MIARVRRNSSRERHDEPPAAAGVARRSSISHWTASTGIAADWVAASQEFTTLAAARRKRPLKAASDTSRTCPRWREASRLSGSAGVRSTARLNTAGTAPGTTMAS